MKKLLLLLFFIPLISIGQVGINNDNPDPSSALDVTSTIGGLLIPRMTENQRNEIIAPATGLMVYQTDNTTGFYYYNGSSWTTFYSKNEVDALITNIQNQLEEQNQNIDNDFDGFSENSGDCDDSDSSIYPGAIEVCGDGIDQDCDGSDTLCNTPPVINSVTITPNTGITVNTTLTGTVTASDADGDSVSLTYEWTADGIVVGTSSVLALSPSSTPAGTTIVLTVYANDGFEDSNSASTSIIVENTPPTAPIVSIIPPTFDGDNLQDLQAVIDTPSTDADGDSVTYEFSWFVDGMQQGCHTDTSTESFFYCPTTASDFIEVIVTPFDGTVSGQSSSYATYLCVYYVEICDDGLDNDCDGAIDEDDSECAGG
jgi:hypothetical protein